MKLTYLLGNVEKFESINRDKKLLIYIIYYDEKKR
jgi:hypothetical protein